MFRCRIQKLILAQRMHKYAKRRFMRTHVFLNWPRHKPHSKFGTKNVPLNNTGLILLVHQAHRKIKTGTWKNSLQRLWINYGRAHDQACAQPHNRRAFKQTTHMQASAQINMFYFYLYIFFYLGRSLSFSPLSCLFLSFFIFRSLILYFILFLFYLFVFLKK